MRVNNKFLLGPTRRASLYNFIPRLCLVALALHKKPLVSAGHMSYQILADLLPTFSVMLHLQNIFTQIALHFFLHYKYSNFFIAIVVHGTLKYQERVFYFTRGVKLAINRIFTSPLRLLKDKR